MKDPANRAPRLRATLLDYGAGNLHSLAKALERAGARVAIEADPARALDTGLLVLPGVGAFGPAAEAIAPARDALRGAFAAGLPCLGICLGMQLLFESSEEGAGEGLGVFEGRVERLRARRVPQIGWNAIDGATDPLFGIARLDIAYFANGYACRARDLDVVARVTHEGDVHPAAVRRGCVLGVQFHPEKSSDAGLAFLEAYVNAIADGAAPARGGARRAAAGERP